MAKSGLGLTLGILTLLGVPLAFSTMGQIRSGFVFAGVALIGFLMAINDKESKGLKTGAQIVCLISIVLNAFIAYACS